LAEFSSGDDPSSDPADEDGKAERDDSAKTARQASLPDDCLTSELAARAAYLRTFQPGKASAVPRKTVFDLRLDLGAVIVPLTSKWWISRWPGNAEDSWCRSTGRPKRLCASKYPPVASSYAARIRVASSWQSVSPRCILTLCVLVPPPLAGLLACPLRELQALRLRRRQPAHILLPPCRCLSWQSTWAASRASRLLTTTRASTRWTLPLTLLTFTLPC
jgi:hypothetical protein